MGRNRLSSVVRRPALTSPAGFAIVNGRERGTMLDQPAALEIGILTRGKPTLSMALASLLLQEPRNLRIHIVDTAERPVIQHEDFSSALRLAFDRGIPCT